MARAIKSIDNATGVITVDDGKTVGGVAPTEIECDFYGGKYSRGVCRIPQELPKKRNDVIKSSNVNGFNNKIIGSTDVSIVGNNNRSRNDVQYIEGNYGDAIRYGEQVYSNSTALGRGQVSTLIFQGRTTNADYTEIFIGGVDGKRFLADESREVFLGFEGYVLGHRVDSGGLGECMNKYQHASFSVTGGSLVQIGSTGTKTNNKNHSNSWNNRYTATSGTPDYIKVEVKGVSSATIDWTVVLKIHELKTDAI